MQVCALGHSAPGQHPPPCTPAGTDGCSTPVSLLVTRGLTPLASFVAPSVRRGMPLCMCGMWPASPGHSQAAELHMCPPDGFRLQVATLTKLDGAGQVN